MRLKISIDASQAEVREIVMAKCKQQIAFIRHDAVYRRRSFFYDSRQIPHEQEVLLGRLYEKIGIDTKPVKKYKKWKEDYLKAISAAWATYYNELAFGEVSERYWQRARSLKYDILIQGYDIAACERIVAAYRGKVESVDPALTEFFDIVEGGNKYELAGYIKREIRLNIFYIGRHPTIELLKSIKMKKGLLRPSIQKLLKGR